MEKLGLVCNMECLHLSMSMSLLLLSTTSTLCTRSTGRNMSSLVHLVDCRFGRLYLIEEQVLVLLTSTLMECNFYLF